jgi:Trk-type K+ transport system membrane component
VQIDDHQIQGTGERIFFSVFHSVSAFCNAGFSTFTNGLYELPMRFNYGVHLVMAFLIIIGGIGYVIVFNYATYLKDWLKARYFRLLKKKNTGYRRPIISLNTKIVVYTTFFLLVVGTVAYFILEYNNTLREHTTMWGKLVTSFFGSVTPRTAGFNTVDVSAMTVPMILLYLILMWIGASPGSTGGGIKTCTFAIGTLNIWQQITGRSRMELGWKEIPAVAARRAFAIISLSLIAVGFSIFFVTIFDPDLALLPVAFECFSAYGTVGLSMGITPHLSDASKLILTVTMFVGRVSFLTVLIGLIQQVFRQKQKPYRFPEEEIFIT